jgi:hypothetical protein
MKGIFTERNFAAILFIMVLITFSFAQKETKKIEQLYNGGQSYMKNFSNLKPEARAAVFPGQQLKFTKRS